MNTWDKIMHSRLFISDLGAAQQGEIEGKPVVIGRYAVWAPITKSDRHQIVEVGDDLHALMEKYHIPTERICSIHAEEA